MNVEQRLERLERENRRLKLTGLIVLSLVGAVFAMGQVRPTQDLVAQKYTLVNSKGEGVGGLALDRQDLPYFYLSGRGEGPGWSSIELRISESTMYPNGPDNPQRGIGPSITLEQHTAPPTGAQDWPAGPSVSISVEPMNMGGAARVVILSHEGRAIWQAP